MSKILIIHRDKSARGFLCKMVGVHHLTKDRDGVEQGLRAIKPYRPDLIIAEMDPRTMHETLNLLRFLKLNSLRIPVVLVGPAGAGALSPMALKSGASAFVEYPMEQEALDSAIATALQSQSEVKGDAPPICVEELTSNISQLELQLNRKMVCVAGKNQVYIQSLILGKGQTSKPRIALKCPLRKQYGFQPEVYYEYIRDVCCEDPSACPAHQEFSARHSA